MEKGRGKGTDTLQTDKVFTRKEYIEREALLRYLNDIWLTTRPTDYMPDDDRQLAITQCTGLNDAMDAVKDAPAADVVARDCYDKILAENDDMRAIIDTYGGLENIQSAFEKLHEIKTADVVPIRQKTNADRIRAMTDEELERFLSGVHNNIGSGRAQIAVWNNNDRPIRIWRTGWLDWLKREVKE